MKGEGHGQSGRGFRGQIELMSTSQKPNTCVSSMPITRQRRRKHAAHQAVQELELVQTEEDQVRDVEVRGESGSEVAWPY